MKKILVIVVVVVIIALIVMFGIGLGFGNGSGNGDGEGQGERTNKITQESSVDDEEEENLITEQKEEKEENNEEDNRENEEKNIKISVVENEYFYENERISLEDFISTIEGLEGNINVEVKDDNASLNAYKKLIKGLEDLKITYTEK